MDFGLWLLRWVRSALILFRLLDREKDMKTLGINSVVMNGNEKTTVTKITSKGVTLTGKKGKQSLTFPLKDVEVALKKGRWKVVEV